MCVFTDILGSGRVLAFQLLTFFSIVTTAGIWAYIFVKNKLAGQLRSFLFPVALWFVFGTLDILVTAKGTFDNPMLESNPATRALLMQFGHWGAPIASVLWICLWAGIVYAINKTRPGKTAEFVSLAIFYSLATGHFFGFSSWFSPLCVFAHGVAVDWLFPAAIGDWRIVLIGTLLGAVHWIAMRGSALRKA